MTQATKTAVLAIIRADATISDEERARIEAALQGDGAAAKIPAVVSRREAAKLIGRTPHLLDYYARRGLLKRVRLGGSSRALGFSVESLRALMRADGEADTATTAREV